MANQVTVSGMFGNGKTYFADSPVMIDISGLAWPGTSPFNVVRMEVVYKRPKAGGGYDMVMAGDFREDTGGQPVASFDISSALDKIWSDYEYTAEVAAARAALTAGAGQAATRNMREYILRIYTEYLSGDDGGVYTTTVCTDSQGNTDIPGGMCLAGGMTEWERSLTESDEDRDVSHFEHTGLRNGDASTKPTSSPERVGSSSITSWVDVYAGGTKSVFYPATVNGTSDSQSEHAPLVLRDTQPYTDFLFVNRRGAVETCSALMLESMGIGVETESYSRIGRPSFNPSRSVMAMASGGRRSWAMSSGKQTREWAEWWTLEFLMARQWWMLYKGSYVPVIVEPAKKQTVIYDKAKQQMPSVEFTVTLALEG